MGRPIGSKDKGNPRNWNKQQREFIGELEALDFSSSWIKKMRMVLYEVPKIINVKKSDDVTRKKYIEYIQYL